MRPEWIDDDYPDRVTVKAMVGRVAVRSTRPGFTLTPEEAVELGWLLIAAAGTAERYEEPAKRVARERKERRRARLATPTQGGRA